MTDKQARAIKWYMDKHNVVPQMSTPPTYYFRAADGTEHTISITTLVSQYERAKKEIKNGGNESGGMVRHDL